jgi:hypothetical protein
MEMNLYNTFTNYYLAIGAFCLASVYFPIESFLTLLFYGWLHHECKPLTNMLNFMFTDPFERYDGKNKFMIFMEVNNNDIRGKNDDFRTAYFFTLFLSISDYLNFWDPMRQEYMIFDTDFNGRTIFYYIDKSQLTPWQKNYLKNAIVKSFKDYLGLHFEPYRVARKEIKRTNKFLLKMSNEIIDAENNRFNTLEEVEAFIKN